MKKNKDFILFFPHLFILQAWFNVALKLKQRGFEPNVAQSKLMTNTHKQTNPAHLQKK